MRPFADYRGIAFYTPVNQSQQASRIALWRLVRRESLQQVLAGFVGVAVSAYVASRTGQAEDFFVLGIAINVVYGLAYLVSILVRWPLLGVLVSLATGEGMGWRQTPHLMRAYTIASWFWVAMFSLRLAVQLPLYLTESIVALGVARVVMGWPLFLLCLWLSWMVIKSARDRQKALEAAEATSAAAVPEPDGSVTSTGDDEPEPR